MAERMLDQGFTAELRPAGELTRLRASDRIRAGQVVREIGLTPRRSSARRNARRRAQW